MEQTKMPFAQFVVRFRQSRKAIYNPAKMLEYSSKYGLDLDQNSLPLCIYTYGTEGHGYIFEDEKIGYWTTIGNQEPVSFSLTDVEWELADWYYGETDGDEFFKPGITEEQRHYLDTLWTNIDHFQKAATDLRIVIEMDDQYKVEANDYIAQNVDERFMPSFDEFEIALRKWSDMVKEKIALKTYLPHTDPVNPLSQAHKPQ